MTRRVKEVTMETLTTKIKKSGKELGEQSSRFLTDTREASKHLMNFVQDEAKDWGGYFRTRYQDFEQSGRKLLRPELTKDTIWVHLDGLLARVTRRNDAEETAPSAIGSEQAEAGANERTDEETVEVNIEDAVDEDSEEDDE